MRDLKSDCKPLEVKENVNKNILTTTDHNIETRNIYGHSTTDVRFLHVF